MWPLKAKKKEVTTSGDNNQRHIILGSSIQLPPEIEGLFDNSRNEHHKAEQQKRLYKQSHFLRRAIDKVKSASLAVKFRVTDVDNNELPEANRNAFSDALRSNPFYTPQSMLNRLILDYLITGNAFVEIQRQPFQLVPHNFKTTYIKEKRNDKLNPFVYEVPNDTGTGNREVLAVDMIHVKNLDPLNPFGYGVSVIESCQDLIRNSILLDITLKEIVKRGSHYKGVLTLKGAGLTKEDADRLYENYEEILSGPKGREIMVITNDMQFTPISMRPIDTGFQSLGEELEKQIHLAYGIPPQVTGIAAASTFSNYQQAWTSFYDDTIGPMLRIILDEFSLKLFPKGDVIVQPDFTGINAFVERMIAQVKGMEYVTAITKGEIREIIGFPKKDTPNEDELLSRAGLLPLKDVGAEFGIDEAALEEM